jgi:hypothetical protein
VQEFFFTILAIWVIWKLFSAFNQSRPRETSQQFHQTNHHHYHQKQEGDVTIQQKKSSKKPGAGDDGEYVDYEEIK